MWTKLNKEGVLSENLLSHMWKECTKEKDSLLDFMKFHHLLYDITGKNEVSVKIHISNISFSMVFINTYLSEKSY